ncbi:CCA tRNA nucleotidyltransferase [Halovenus sp. WSH3]|uniref:CCA-adding enzyme n=1 Tax=Halovenus carboxidivorans TaxID=2692199 RepID=A0A6B0TBM6_9EURY|nr:CCA tRNA nucleotidyltransferase [Halovenus carboxidivorans]MXR52782.1 CCA tRNA nucleotidyltransferase [Halovenus carboxidivorans]
MSDEFDAVVDRVRQRVEPDDAEREALEATTETLIARANEAIADLPVEAEMLRVGSTARDTWLAGDRDIDLFVRFPADLDRDELESYGLDVGHAALPDGREEYAEHPYVVGECDGFEVDLVPCYDVADATAIKSAVDRTPFHTEYVRDRLTPELASDVRVCKQFFTGIGVYGSDLRTRGFSGVLTELLVIEHGGFRPLIEAAAEWHPPVEFDPEGHAEETFDDPLVVIDPTDPERNVAAVCSADNVARLQHFARELLAEPRDSLFTEHRPEPLDSDAITAEFDRRGTTPIAIRFPAPDIVDDQLWPQLERSRKGIREELDRLGFDVFRTDAFAGSEAVLLFELSVAERPAVERHEGPPVHVREHADRFYDAYAEGNAYGPFIDGDRYVVERERSFSSAVDFLDSDALFDVALGAHVESALESGYELLVGDDIGVLAEQFGTELARYLDPTPRG